ncbi:concanavalin A-like lectin/glucanase domain-containing protein [Thamnidium elegans]|nr:concanavalin A-like lectin/glucanase domain-containing protein [Thamnidium elegans]
MAYATPIYDSGFPALDTTETMEKQNRQNAKQNSSANLKANRSLGRPKYPSYLKQAHYENILLEQYNLQLLKQRIKSKHVPLQSLPKTSCLEDDQLEELDLRLPTFWNTKDKSKNIEVGSNGLDLSYIGPGIQETHAALVRSNFPMRPQCGIFYYEMKVLSKGDDGFIGIGFCCSSNKLERLPGWDLNSWGYHGDDGHSFAGSGTGKDYGPRFSTGDTIGCGVNFADYSAFYTKNGRHLGTAFRSMELKKPIYPAIGLRTPRERVTTNFGHEPFVFDIEQFVKDQKLQFIKEITQDVNKTPKSLMKIQDKEATDQLILSYLIHHGYTNTAKAVVQNTGHVSEQELFLSNNTDISKIGERDMEERQLIRAAIVKGDIEEAMKLIDMYFPGVLQEEGRGKELQLGLKCGRFIEIMREYFEYNKSRTSHYKRVNDVPETCCTNSLNRTTSQKRRLSYAAIAASLSPSNSTELSKSDMMDIDHLSDNALCGNVWESASSATNNKCSTTSEINNGSDEYLNRAVEYGKLLREEYPEKIDSSLKDPVSLLAYSKLDNCSVAYLLDISRRDLLATKVNAAILAFQNRPEMPAIERVYRQVMLCNKELVCEGNGKAALINIEDYCSNNMEL